MASANRSWARLLSAPGWGLAGLLLLGTGLVLAPLLLIVWSPPPALGRPSPVSAWSALTEPHLRRLLWTTLRLAGWVTLATLVMGVPLGLWLARRRGLRGMILAGLHVLPLCLPPYVTALAWTRVLGREGLVATLFGPGAGALCSRWLYGEAGVVLTLAVALGPVVTLLTAAFLRGVDPARVEAGRLCRGSARTTWGIELPLALPGIGAGALLVFVQAASEVAVAQLLRVPVYASVVFSRLADLSFQPGEALALAVPTTALALAVALALHRLDHRGRWARGLRDSVPAGGVRGLRPRVHDGLAFGVVGLALMPVVLLVADALGARGGGADGLRAAWPALANSLRYATASACVMTVIALVFSALWLRRPRATSWLAIPLLLGFVLPSSVLALALASTWNSPSTLWVYRTDLIIGLGLCARYAYVPLRVAKLGRDQVPPSWTEAARLTPASWVARLWRVDLPLLRNTVIVTWCVGFVLAFRDLETTILFYPPGGESLPVRTMTLEANSPPGATAASAALQVAVVALLVVALAVAAWLQGRRQGPGKRGSP